MSIDYNLVCDRCGRTIDGSFISPAHVRRAAKQQGAAIRHGNKDICVLCVRDEATEDMRQ